MRAVLEAVARHARDRPRTVAIVDVDGDAVGWAEIAERSATVRDFVERQVASDGNVAISLPPGPDFWCAMIGVSSSGRMPCLLPHPLPGLLAARLPAELHSPFVLDPTALAEARNSAALQTRTVEPRGAMLLSSGTTGRSRFIVRSPQAIDAIAAGLLEEELAVADDVVASFLPMAHAYGFEHAFLGPALAGARVHALGAFAIDRAAQAMREGATSLPLVPITADALVGAVPRSSELRSVVVAGTVLPDCIRRRFEPAFGLRLVDLYGATELGTIWLDRGEGGRPVRGVEVLLRESAGMPGVGEITVRSEGMLSGIVESDGIVAPGAPNGAFATGDLGKTLVNGTFAVCGRLKLVFDVGGLKVNPIEVEQALETHHAIRRALVRPIQARDGLNRVVATIELKVGASTVDANDVRAHLAPLLSSHAIPRSFEVVDRLPTTASGKLDRSGAFGDRPNAPHSGGRTSEPISPVERRPKGLESLAERERYTKRLFDETARGYDHSSGAAFLRSGRWYRRRMLLRAGLRPGSAHLDVGSGTGLCAAIAQPIVGTGGRAVALDPSTGMLEMAKRRGVRETVEGRAERLPFADASFDSISMSYMLRHIEDLAVAFREARRVLRPGGRLVIFEVTRPVPRWRRIGFDVAMRWVVPSVGVIASGRPSTFAMMRYWADTIEAAARPERVVEALDRSGFVGTRHLLELGVFSCYRGVAPLAS